jgi:hypothetical protein
MRLQRTVQTFVYAATVAFLVAAVALFALKLGVLVQHHFLPILAACLTATLVASFVQGARRLSLSEVARQIDLAHNRHHLLGSAVEFSARSGTTALMKAHIAQTERALADLSPRDTAPLRRPRASGLLAVNLAALVIVSALQFAPVSSSEPPVSRPANTGLGVDSPVLAKQRQALGELRDRLQRHDSQQLQAISEEITRLLDHMRQAQLTRAQVLSRLAALERQLEASRRVETRRMIERLRELGRELERRAVAEQLAAALRRADPEDAATEAQQLAKRTAALSASQRRRLAKALRTVDRDDRKRAQLRRDGERLRRSIRRLERQHARRPRDRQLLRRLRRSERRLQKLNERRQALEQSGRQLRQLNQTLDRAARALRRDESDEAQRALNRLARQLRQVAPSVETDQLANATRQRVEKLTELLQRLGQRQRSRLARLRRFRQRASGRWSETKAPRESAGRRGLLLVPRRAEGPESRAPRDDGQTSRLGTQLVRAGSTTSPGTARDPTPLGAKTKHQSRSGRAEPLTGVAGEGPTQSQVIESAAQREGFATRGYRRVYERYHEASIDDIQREDVPVGRRQLVKWYFDLIRPPAD